MREQVNDPGEMRERIAVFAPYPEVRKGGIVSKPSASNTPLIGNWYAKIEFLSGREFYSDHQTAIEAEIKVTVRYKKEINEQYFFDWQNKKYDITRITHTPCKSHTIIYAKRRR